MIEIKQLATSKGHAHQRVIKTRRPNGSLKEREIWEPDEELLAEHHRVLAILHGLDMSMPHALGGMPGSTIYDNAARHRRSNDFYLLDLEDAYQSIDVDRLRETMRRSLAECAIRAAQTKEIDDFITCAATIEGVQGLPLGLPASPFLCNVYFAPMDRGLHFALNGQRTPEDPNFVTVTRWIDDIALSSARKVFTAKTRRLVREIIQLNGGKVNHGKSKRHSLANGPVTITGMSLYPDRRIAPSPKLMEQVTSHLRMAEAKFALGELTWADIDDLNGQKSILHMTKDGLPSSSGQKSVRQLAEKYVLFIERATGSLGPRVIDDEAVQ